MAINNQKIVKWKFLKPGTDAEANAESCSMRIYSSITKNFSSAYYVLDELISQMNECQFRCLPINDIWNNLIKIACVQVFWKRLKVISLLIKIMTVVEKYHDKDRLEVDLFALKPLKNLQYNLLEASANNTSNTSSSVDDKNLQRALYELFFFAERLSIKFSMQGEYRARMKDQAEIVEMVCDTAYLVNIIKQSILLPSKEAKSVARSSSSLDLSETAKPAAQDEILKLVERSESDSNDETRTEKRRSRDETDEGKLKHSNDEEETVEEDDCEEDDVVRSLDCNEDYDEDQDYYNDHDHNDEVNDDQEESQSGDHSNSKKLPLTTSDRVKLVALDRFPSKQQQQQQQQQLNNSSNRNNAKDSEDDTNEP